MKSGSGKNLSLLDQGEELVARVFEEGGPYLRVLIVQQVDRKQRAFSLGVRPAANVCLGSYTSLYSPPVSIEVNDLTEYCHVLRSKT